MVTVKEERAKEWGKVNDAMDVGNYQAALAAMDSLEVMIQGEEKAETELKKFHSDVEKQEKIDKENMLKSLVQLWGEVWYENEDAVDYRDKVLFKIGMRNINERRKFLYRLARQHNLFVAGE